MKIKLCKDCKWYDSGRCKSPRQALDTDGLVFGKKLYDDSCKAQRHELLFLIDDFLNIFLKVCGKRGRFFEPKEV